MSMNSILLVCKKDEYIEKLMLEMKKHKLNFECINNGNIAVNLIFKLNPKAIIVGYQLEDMDCFEFLKELRNKMESGIPQLIGILESNEKELNDEMYKAGVKTFYVKDEHLHKYVTRTLLCTMESSNMKKEYQELSNILEYTSQKLEDAERMQTEFITNISHEIRTPLSIIIGFSELAKLKTKDSQLLEYIDSINMAGSVLLDLLNDLLKLSKLEQGRIVLNADTLELKKYFNDIKKYYKDSFSKAGIDFIYEIDKTVPQKIITDASIVRQILFNLIGNCLKYTKEGYVKLKAKMNKPLNHSKKRDLVIVIEDTGKGLKKDEEEFLFQSVGKAGLALSISKKLLIMLGGDLIIENRKEGGMRFIVEIPVEL
jgi:signal transduction histidine kinase